MSEKPSLKLVILDVKNKANIYRMLFCTPTDAFPSLQGYAFKSKLNKQSEHFQNACFCARTDALPSLEGYESYEQIRLNKKSDSFLNRFVVAGARLERTTFGL